MKNWLILSILLLVCCSCAKQKQAIQKQAKPYPFNVSEEFPVWDSAEEARRRFPIWDGESPLFPADKISANDEPLCIIMYESTPWSELTWFPTKIIYDTETIKKAIDYISHPEQPAGYLFKSGKYLMIYSASRDLNSHKAILVPFVFDLGRAYLPNGYDRRLYKLLTETPNKENFYGNAKDANDMPPSSGEKHTEPQPGGF